MMEEVAFASSITAENRTLSATNLDSQIHQHVDESNKHNNLTNYTH